MSQQTRAIQLILAFSCSPSSSLVAELTCTASVSTDRAERPVSSCASSSAALISLMRSMATVYSDFKVCTGMGKKIGLKLEHDRTISRLNFF